MTILPLLQLALLTCRTVRVVQQSRHSCRRGHGHIPSSNSRLQIAQRQNCRLTEDKCPHRGCADTKRLLIHVKTCPAGPGVPCPTRCKGCNETRKLLAHYRRCKDMRAKKRRSGSQSQQPDQSCLVCSLMARYAKGMLDRTNKRSSSPKNTTTAVAMSLSSSFDGRFKLDRGSAKCDKIQARVKSSLSPIKNRTPSMTLMPPPPPRSRSSRHNGSIPSLSTIEISLANECFPCPPPPSPSRFDSAAAISSNPYASIKSRSGTTSNATPMGKSVDTNIRIPFPILRNGPSAAIATTHLRHRQRAESYDERLQTRVVKFAPAIVTSEQYYSNEYEEERPLGSTPSQGIRNNATNRPRSASVGSTDGNSTMLSAHGCDTIAEDGVEEEPIHISH